MKGHRTLCGIVSVAAMTWLFAGCFPANKNPLLAASAAVKIQQALSSTTSETEQLLAVGTAISGLTTGELASAVNLASGKDWSLDDAAALQQLLGQVTEDKINALSDANVTDPNAPTDEIVQALTDAGFDVTTQQVELMQELFDVFGE